SSDATFWASWRLLAAVATPVTTRSSLCLASRSRLTSAQTTATRSGSATRPKPTRIRPLRDRGRGSLISRLSRIPRRKSSYCECGRRVHFRRAAGRLRHNRQAVAGRGTSPAVNRGIAGCEPPLPVEGGPDDQVEIVVARRPAEHVAHALGHRDQHRRVSRAARRFANVERRPAGPFDGGPHPAYT